MKPRQKPNDGGPFELTIWPHLGTRCAPYTRIKRRIESQPVHDAARPRVPREPHHSSTEMSPLVRFGVLVCVVVVVMGVCVFVSAVVVVVRGQASKSSKRLFASLGGVSIVLLSEGI